MSDQGQLIPIHFIYGGNLEIGLVSNRTGGILHKCIDIKRTVSKGIIVSCISQILAERIKCLADLCGCGILIQGFIQRNRRRNNRGCKGGACHSCISSAHFGCIHRAGRNNVDVLASVGILVNFPGVRCQSAYTDNRRMCGRIIGGSYALVSCSGYANDALCLQLLNGMGKQIFGIHQAPGHIHHVHGLQCNIFHSDQNIHELVIPVFIRFHLDDQQLRLGSNTANTGSVKLCGNHTGSRRSVAVRIVDDRPIVDHLTTRSGACTVSYNLIGACIVGIGADLAGKFGMIVIKTGINDRNRYTVSHRTVLHVTQANIFQIALLGVIGLPGNILYALPCQDCARLLHVKIAELDVIVCIQT